MLDLLIRNARVAGLDRPAELAVRDGRWVAPEPEARELLDLRGALVTPPLVEPHIHLDAVLTVGQPRHNQTGSLFEGIAIWADRVKTLTVEDVKARVRKTLRWQLANGVQHVRSHVDVCDPELRALRALVELRDEVGDQMGLQLVAFPQQGILSFEGGAELMRRAVALGADVIGGIPHFELTREMGVDSVKFAFALAAEHGLRVDIHCDETDDDHSRFVEVMAAETLRLGLEGRVTASHTTAMHSYNNAYANKLIRLVRVAGLHFVTNPLDSSVLQGRFDSYPIRRGFTRVKELLRAGVNVAIGHDSIMDPWYPLGIGDPVQACFVMVHYGQMSGRDELQSMLDFVTTRAARCLGLADYGVAEGMRADLVVFDAPAPVEAVRTLAARTAVISRGRVVARTSPAR